MRHSVISKSFVILFGLLVMAGNQAQAAMTDLNVPVNRSELLILPASIAEVAIANPQVVDVAVHGLTRVSIIGKAIGRTNVRIFDEENNLLRDMLVSVTYDLPRVRKVLKTFFPNEAIGVEMINQNIALVGDVSDALTAQQAVKVVNEFINDARAQSPAAGNAQGAGSAEEDKIEVVNLTKIRTGQQVMLRVRIGEIKRTTLRKLGVNFGASKTTPGSDFGLVTVGGDVGGDFAGTLFGSLTRGAFDLGVSLDALEQQGLLKILAEPNLTAISGEKAEFVAGGEFPVPSWDGGDSDQSRVTIEFRKFGVAVQFTPIVLSSNRIRLIVQPEVSEPTGTAYEVFGFPIQSLSTRKVNTTIELSAGESFMIAGLIRDKIDVDVDSLPGISEVPILSSMFRSSSFEREETELVIAVTPYLVDPVVGSDIKLPADHYKPASMMETVFYGALGGISDESIRVTQTPNLEGPIGFMVD